MNLVAYLRYSTHSQDDTATLEIQRESISSWSEANEHAILFWEEDKALSGTLDHENGRDGLAAALERIQAGEAEGLVFYDVTRFARSLTVQEAAYAHVWKSDGRVFDVKQGEILEDDPDDPMRTAMRQTMGVFSQLERGMIVARLRAGRKHMAQNGGYAFGAPPYGYRSIEGTLIPIPAQQEAIKRIVALREQGLTLRAIAQQLEESGIPPRRGAHWSPETIRGILKRA